MKEEPRTRYYCDGCGDELYGEDRMPINGAEWVSVERIHPIWGQQSGEKLHYCHGCVPEEFRSEWDPDLFDPVFNVDSERVVSGKLVWTTYGDSETTQKARDDFDDPTEKFAAMIEEEMKSRTTEKHAEPYGSGL